MERVRTRRQRVVWQHTHAWRCDGRPERARRAQPAVHRAQGRATGALRVLVVDDDPSIRFVCRFNLEAAGIEVLEAVDGEQGIEMARSEGVDLVLLDVMMPRRDGWEVAEELATAAAEQPPIVFLTARADRSDRERAARLGAVGYVTKPFDPVELVERIPRILEAVERGERERLRREVVAEGP